MGTNVDTTRDNIRYSALIEDFGEDTAYPVFFRLCGHLGSTVYDPHFRERDRLISLGATDGTYDTLAYFVLVAGRSFEVDKLNCAPAAMTQAQFAYFNVHIGSVRFGLPGLNFGRTIPSISAPAQVNGVDVTSNPMESLYCMDAETLTRYIQDKMRELIASVVETASIRNDWWPKERLHFHPLPMLPE
ncbi:hypothetical protein ACFQX4_17980 [Roseomonas sp. GCM10028921]